MHDRQVGWERAVGPVAAGLLTAAGLTVAILPATRSDTRWRTLRYPSAGLGWLLVAAGVYGIYDAYTPPEGYQLDDWQKFLLAGPRAAMLVVAALTVWLAARAPQTDRDRAPTDDTPVAIEMQ